MNMEWIYGLLLAYSALNVLTIVCPSSEQALYNCSDACLEPSFGGCVTVTTDATTKTDLPTCNTSGHVQKTCDRLTGQCLSGCTDIDLAGPFCNISCFENQIYNCLKCDYDEVQSEPVCEQCSKDFFLASGGRCVECPKGCRAYNSSVSRCGHDGGNCVFGCKDGYHDIRCGMQCTALCYPRACDQFDACCTGDCYFDFMCGCQCSAECSATCLNQTCNPNCTCKHGCISGYYGNICDQNCSENCIVSDNTTLPCNDTYDDFCYNGCINDTSWTGTCDRPCADGCANRTCDRYSGDCTQGCLSQMFYSSNCSLECSNTCEDQQCFREDGICLRGCVPGQWGDFCEFHCNTNCKNQTCDRYNETCTYGCIPGHWGDYCEFSCYINCKDQTCDRYNETCTDGCTDGFYGIGCNETCSVNCMFDSCDMMTGVCTHGCKEQYTGDDCSKAKPTVSIGVIAGAVFGGVAALIIVVLGYFVWKKQMCVRRNKNKVDASPERNVDEVDDLHHTPENEVGHVYVT